MHSHRLALLPEYWLDSSKRQPFLQAVPDTFATTDSLINWEYVALVCIHNVHPTKAAHAILSIRLTNMKGPFHQEES